ncbi:hypothetical protein ES702_03173 [subsurface metagenome]
MKPRVRAWREPSLEKVVAFAEALRYWKDSLASLMWVVVLVVGGVLVMFDVLLLVDDVLIVDCCDVLRFM